MVTVRRYTGRVEENPLPNTDRNIRPQQLLDASYGSPMSEAGRFQGAQLERFGIGLRQFGSDLKRVEDEREKEALKFDKSVVRQRENEDRTWAREYLVDQYSKYQGEQAIKSDDDQLSVYERTKQALVDRRRERLKDLDTEQQREIYQVVFDDIEQRALSDTSLFVRKANDQLEKQSYLASAESKFEDIIANRNDDKRIATDLDLAERDLKNYYRGMPKEFVDVQLQNYHDKVHKGVVSAFIIDKDPVEAWNYYRANEKEISSPVKLELEANLKSATLEHLTRIKSRELQIDQKYKTFSERLEAVKDITSPLADDMELQKRVREQLLADHDLENKIKVEDHRKYFESKIEEINNAETLGKALEIARSAIGSDETKLRKIAQDIFTSGSIQTDKETYYRLKTLPYEEFTKIDLLKYRHLLGNTEFKELVNLQLKEQKDQKPVRVRTNLAMANDALEAVGLYDDRRDKSRSERRQRFFTDLEERLLQIQTKTGKEPDSTEVKQEINDLLIEFYEKSWFPFFRDEKRKFEINTPEERGDSQYTPKERPKKLPQNANWSWDFDGWVFDYEGKKYVYRNKKVFLIPEDR